tara:strand:- start:230 stop:424 length:195 start_codon:yes stop_codon:yes gene_type:complete
MVGQAFTATEIVGLVRHYGFDRDKDGNLKEWATGTDEEQVAAMEKTLDDLVDQGMLETNRSEEE